MMNIYVVQFFSIALIHLLAVASPGPDFAVVVKNSISYGKKAGFFTSLGIGLGILFHLTYILLGIGILVSKSILVFNIMKYLAAIYLIYIGIKGIKTKEKTNNDDINIEEITSKQAFITGFMTNGLNPKAALFFLSLFTVMIKPETPIHYQIFYSVYLVLATIVWFFIITKIFSHSKVRDAFNKFGHWFERIMGGILILFGIKLFIANK